MVVTIRTSYADGICSFIKRVLQGKIERQLPRFVKYYYLPEDS